jgi:6-phosphogluconate dehydrogenase
MQTGFVGLGKMGLNMVRRLMSENEHDVVVYDRSRDAAAEAARFGARKARSLRDLAGKLSGPRTIWLMIPAGDPVDQVIGKLAPFLSEGDCIIDGGNSNYKDSVRRARDLKSKGVDFLDVGTSGGIWGLKEGYCLMVGGRAGVYRRHEPLFRTLAPEGGYGYMGAPGAGHYVKMVHNGIEYGLMQAYAEGFSLLESSDYDLDLEKICGVWGNGSVVRSWLLELAQRAFKEDGRLADIKPYVADSGEGRWTVLDGLEKDISIPVITLSLLYRLRSREENPFAARLLAALRNQFGGHAVKKE